ncbi:MAG: toxin-antitoxin system YwqK family antitoxin [Cyclobacteriaceae bacterium]
MNSVTLNYWDLVRSSIAGRQERKVEPKQGKWKEYNKHAILIAEGHYVDGHKQGRWKEYFDSGELMLEEDFERGIPDGRFISYHRNGRILSEGNFKNGLRSGEFRVYDEQGVHTKSLWFDDDTPVEGIDLDQSIKP